MSNGVTPAQFIAKWSRVELSERAASQEHFIDLCRLLSQPTPAEHDATGAEYTFDKGVTVLGGAASRRRAESAGAPESTRGFADVWWRGKFGWEYKRKGKYKDLTEAYRQLCQYREALENPPLLVVCDIARTEIHTNFTGTKKEVHEIRLPELGEPENLDQLRRVFTDPDSFKPTLTTWRLTENVAAEFAKISDALRQRKHDPHAAAHFLMKCMFCLFAEDVKLLPERLFSKLLERGQADPDRFPARLTELFRTMGRGGDFGTEEIAWFNGGLFDDAPALPLLAFEIHTMLIAAQHDWGAVEPSIFGTLFERSLDPDKRAQIGAHYTSRDDILLIVEPVVMAPLRREWSEVKAQVEKLLTRRREAGTKATKRKADDAIAKAIEEFHHRLATIRILDPACGSGNFLYVAIQELLSLEKEVIVFAGRQDIGTQLFPRVRPTQLHGIEINPYAAELAQVVIWIGYLQWMRDNGFAVPRHPILEPLQTIENRDAILDLTIPTKPQPATWPQADFIIGNPPFLGGSFFRDRFGTEYAEKLWSAYALSAFSDLCCYWFEQARGVLGKRPGTRVGLLATQGIRGGANREVLERIKSTGDIFMAWSDRDWVLDGAAVHISMVGFDGGRETHRVLDGLSAPCINADLTVGADIVSARPLPENARTAFRGNQKGGAFDISWEAARQMLGDANPSRHTNYEVLKPYRNGMDLMRRHRAMWLIDFGTERPLAEASGFAAPFAYVEKKVRPTYASQRNTKARDDWWIHERPRPEMRAALARLERYCVCPHVAKHFAVAWISTPEYPDHQLIAFARSDDYFFGVVHGSVHELWARSLGTQVREAESGFRYTPTTCFSTFPLPWPPGSEPRPSGSGPRSEPRPLGSGPPSANREPLPHGRGSDQTRDTEPLPHGRGSDRAARDAELHQRISDAARELNEQRERWLNPPEWIEALGKAVDRQDDFADVPEAARPLIRWSAIMDMAAHDSRFKKRTLTHLYNERPTWLKLAHEKLDQAVLAAYAAVDPEGGWSEDWAAVWTATGAGQPPAAEVEPASSPGKAGAGVTAAEQTGTAADRTAAAELGARRKETDQRVLANLLRMNLARAGK